jgi:hypothetical protein
LSHFFCPTFSVKSLKCDLTRKKKTTLHSIQDYLGKHGCSATGCEQQILIMKSLIWLGFRNYANRNLHIPSSIVDCKTFHDFYYQRFEHFLSNFLLKENKRLKNASKQGFYYLDLNTFYCFEQIFTVLV